APHVDSHCSGSALKRELQLRADVCCCWSSTFRLPVSARGDSSAAGIGRTPRPGQPRLAVRWVLSPHPSPLPWGEGEPFSLWRTIQSRRLSTTRCAPFPLPEGEGQGEGKRRGLPSPVSDHSRKCRTGRVLRQSRRFR